MKKIILGVVGLLSLMLLSEKSIAQCFENPVGSGNFETVLGEPCVNTIVTAVPFLRIVGDARSGAMGDAGIAISSDANAMHFNSSKLVFSEQTGGASVTYTPWLRALNVNDVYLAYLTGFYKLDDLQAVGFGLRFFSLGDIAFTNEQGEPLGNGRPREFEISGAYARKLTDNLSAGIGAKFIYSNLASGQEVGGEEISAGTAGAADVSLTYKTPIEINKGVSNLTVGLAFTNIGSKITYTNSTNKDFIPTNMGLGLAWDFDIDEYNRFTFATDINKLLVPTPIHPMHPDYDTDKNDIPDYKEGSPISGVFSSFGDAPDGFSEELRELMFSFGVEYWYDKQFAVRAGYFFEHSTKGNRKYLTVGLGLKYNVFGLNLSYLVPTTSQRNPLDNTLRFSLLFDFESFDAELEE